MAGGKDAMINRLRRIEGQIRGLQRMIEDDRDCEEVLIQINAVTSAIQKVKEVILKEYVSRCLLEYEATGDRSKLDSLISLVSRYMGGRK